MPMIRISQTGALLQHAEDRKQKLQDNQQTFLAPLQTLLPFFDSEEARTAAADNNLFALTGHFLAQLTLPIQLLGS